MMDKELLKIDFGILYIIYQAVIKLKIIII